MNIRVDVRIRSMGETYFNIILSTLSFICGSIVRIIIIFIDDTNLESKRKLNLANKRMFM